MTCLRDIFNLKLTQVLSQKSKNGDKTNSRVSDPHTPSHVTAVCPGLVKFWLVSGASEQTGK